MSNKIRARNRQPFDFQDGIKVRGKEIAYYVNTLADLRAIDISTLRDNEVCIMLGNSSVNDGSGGTYYFDKNGSAAGNGLNVILPISNPSVGRWIKINFS